MFHTLSELNEKEKNKGKQNQKKNSFNMSKGKSPEDNYYGKGNKAYDHYNKRPSESLNVKFEKTKNKITLIVFQNGFNKFYNDGACWACDVGCSISTTGYSPMTFSPCALLLFQMAFTFSFKGSSTFGSFNKL